ncbi:DUF4139 domain-containing protein [Halarcobacter sp.]|uniref:DUF4139 domain-containing protein n=1 Tax=Halarcobacter sp. TaxID=2321133 RepID=UPI0029F45AB5|nr:DUF4139 domain-containing protein [Halarcobacter sp.]
MKIILPLLLATTSLVFANNSIKSLDIFKNKSFVNQSLDSNKNSLNLLGVVSLENIRFLMDSSCKVNSFDIEIEDYENDKLSTDINNLEEKINKKENEIKALNSNISFLEKSNLSSLKDLKVLEKTSSYITEQILKDYNKIYSLENQIKKDKEELQELNKKRINSKYTKLNYDIACKDKVIVNYPIYTLKKQALYDINYDTDKKNLELKNQLYITQSSGMDLKDIDINLYTYNYINQIKPYNFVPEYLDLEPKQEIAYAKAMNDMQPVMMKSARVLKKPTFEYLEDNTKSFFKASHIDLISGKENKVLFANDIYKADDILEIDGYSQSQAFFKVNFKSKKLYGISNANLYLDGTYVGKSNLDEIKKDKDSSIYFSTNRFIDIEKKLLKDLKEEPFFSVNKIKTEKIWEYKITNNSNVAQKIVLLERVPVSKHEDIKVKLIGKSKETKLEKNGKIYFEFNLEPKETKEINFGYEIEKPNKK